jgi:regulator of replication initiation timing
MIEKYSLSDIETAFFDLEQENKDLRIELEKLKKKFDEKTDDGCESESLKVRDEQGIPLELAVLRREYVSMIKYAELGRLALEVSNTNPAITSFCKTEYQKKYHGTDAFCLTVKCPWRSFCQKRAELLVKVRK